LNRGGSHDFFSQSCLGVLAQTLGDVWAVAREIAQRVGGDPGAVALSERGDPFVGGKPGTVVALETGGWSRVSDEVKALFQQWLSQLSGAGVRVLTRRELPELDALERALSDALELTRSINAWESRWPLKAYRALGDGLSDVLLDRLAIAEKMSVAQYTDAVARRGSVRRLHSGLHGKCDALVTLSAPDCAPAGLASTGDPAFAVPASLLGAPAVSIPLLKAHGLPLGIQVIGFQACDSDMFGIARWLASRN
jgi:Asp-tRNA(Asn)/Glu-tRNA(Gln) amidotransferase A subunit family amidase